MSRAPLRRKDPDAPVRLPIANITYDESKRFQRQVEIGDRGRAITALFRLMQDATQTDRRLWRLLLDSPKKLEIRRREG